MKREDYPESRKEQEESERDTLPLVDPPAPYGPAGSEGPPTRTEIHRPPQKEESKSNRHEKQ